jgi:hypothetical protein
VFRNPTRDGIVTLPCADDERQSSLHRLDEAEAQVDCPVGTQMNQWITNRRKITTLMQTGVPAC